MANWLFNFINVNSKVITSKSVEVVDLLMKKYAITGKHVKLKANYAKMTPYDQPDTQITVAMLGALYW